VSRRLRTAVVGGGLIAQAIHLPNLARCADAFEIVAIADVSRRVADGLAARYAPARAYTEWRAMLDDEHLDAIVVCSPHATHAEVALAALDRGLHVLVEKPLCIAPEDAAAICRRRDETSLVVQVGYMKRYDAAYEPFLDALPPSADGLRLVDVVTYDPWMAREPFVPWSRMIRGDDVPQAVLAAARGAEAEQVERAVGSADPAVVRAYSYTFLACLVHDVNLVHGALERLGIGDVEPLSAAHWAGGDAASFTARLPSGAVWQCAWLLLRGLEDFRERAAFYFAESIHELEMPVPYWPDAPRVHRISGKRDDEYTGDAYVGELRHFHACVVDGIACRTPADQGARDLALLRDLFRLTTPLI
jgi:Oxidoreductase family, NAD-binding Rossmann fold